MIEKLANLGPIVVINLERRRDRKKHIQKLFTKYKITDYTFFKAIEGSDITSGTHEMSPGEIGCSMSHLVVIRDWLYSDPKTPWLVVMEDDISFDTVKHWRWTWSEIIDSIQVKYDILHLTAPALDIFNPDDLRIRKIEKDTITPITTCYMVSRDGAKKIIDRHTLNGKLFFNPDDRKNVADHDLLYKAVDHAYKIPFFTPARNLGTDINTEEWIINFLDESKRHTEWLLEHATIPLNKILDLT